MRDQIEQTRRILRSLERLVKQSGDRPLPTEILSRALIQVMRNQLALLGAFGNGAGESLAAPPSEAADASELDPDDALDRTPTRETDGPASAADGPDGEEPERTTAEETKQESTGGAKPETSPDIPVAPSDVAKLAVEAFELEKLLTWLEGGTLFQLRGEFAFVKASSFALGAADQTTETLARLGYGTRVGRLDIPELSEVVILYRNPGGGKRSWDD